MTGNPIFFQNVLKEKVKKNDLQDLKIQNYFRRRNEHV